MKSSEMTVRRAIAIIQVFDGLEAGQDWTDAHPKDLKAAMGDVRFDPTQAIWPELWARYKAKTLHRQVLDLVANLDLEGMSKASRKEIEDGIAKFG